MGNKELTTDAVTVICPTCGIEWVSSIDWSLLANKKVYFNVQKKHDDSNALWG